MGVKQLTDVRKQNEIKTKNTQTAVSSLINRLSPYVKKQYDCCCKCPVCNSINMEIDYERNYSDAYDGDWTSDFSYSTYCLKFKCKDCGAYGKTDDFLEILHTSMTYRVSYDGNRYIPKSGEGVSRVLQVVFLIIIPIIIVISLWNWKPIGKVFAIVFGIVSFGFLGLTEHMDSGLFNENNRHASAKRLNSTVKQIRDEKPEACVLCEYKSENGDTDIINAIKSILRDLMR